MFDISSVETSLIIIILLLAISIGYIYILKTDIELLKEDIYKLKYNNNNLNN